MVNKLRQPIGNKLIFIKNHKCKLLLRFRWKNTGETCSRNEKGKESKANSLGVDNIGGVFVVLLCGLAFAVIIAIFEFCYNSKKNAITEKVVLKNHVTNIKYLILTFFRG